MTHLRPLPCNGENESEVTMTRRRLTTAAAAAAVAAAILCCADGSWAQSARQWRIAVIGDSLSVGYGIESGEAYPAVLGRLLQGGGWSVAVRTFGNSGDTTADGFESMEEAQGWAPNLVIVAVGGNDGMRGLRTEAVEYNLRRIIAKARESGARVLLTGMIALPRHGPAYEQRFYNVFLRVAADTGTDLMPFLLDGVAGVDELNQGDRIHPNAAGADRIARGLWPYVNDALIALARQ